MRLPCAERERFLPADCVTARRNEARCIGAGESRGDYALACFIFRILRRPLDAAALVIEKLLGQIKGVTSNKEDQSPSVQPDIYFLFHVNIESLKLNKLIYYLEGMPEGPHDILQTEFELIKKTLDTFEKDINTNLDELSKKYSSVNSNYDNFVKIVSSTMNTLLEMAKGFLRF